MPKKKAKKPDASYESFRAQWERAEPRRLQRQRGRGKPGDINYRPPVIGSPRPHKTKTADFLDELLWLGTYVGDERFNQAYLAVQESGAIKDRKWGKDFRFSSPPGHTPDPFDSCVSLVARRVSLWRVAASAFALIGGKPFVAENLSNHPLSVLRIKFEFPPFGPQSFLRIGSLHDGTTQGSNTRIGALVPTIHRITVITGWT